MGGGRGGMIPLGSYDLSDPKNPWIADRKRSTKSPIATLSLKVKLKNNCLNTAHVRNFPLFIHILEEFYQNNFVQFKIFLEKEK